MTKNVTNIKLKTNDIKKLNQNVLQKRTIIVSEQYLNMTGVYIIIFSVFVSPEHYSCL